MTRFEEKLKERDEMFQDDMEIEIYIDEVFENEGLDIRAGVKNLLGADSNQNKLQRNYNKNMADRMIDEYHTFESHLDEMGGKAFPDDMTFKGI